MFNVIIFGVTTLGSKTNVIQEVLEEFRNTVPGVEGACLVSGDGLMIASALPAGIEEDRVAAMAAAILSLGERVTGELNRGAFGEVYVRGDKGYVVISEVGKEAVLVTIASKDVKLGLLFLDMRRAADRIKEVL
ncbi:MAG TPA: hypothetical protein ENF65_01465 [Euryarchaeota archaeon]|nr:MAG: hypothetical protein DRN46_05690 [Thermococci archaeon]RLF96739.1 MAG: hypothetical protein DRN52_01880 [Thermococci archaeon]HDI10395.1 hypothetical protein [Euryarchaeota archaeon]